jgi:RNA polymerase sigma-70 factor (ECF subfamily)
MEAPSYRMPEESFDPPDDAALVLEVAAGSEDALAALYDRHVDTIHALAMRLAGDRSIAEEVVQETFLALWNRAELYDPAIGALTAWLRTIARNRTVDRLRSAGRRPTLVPLSSNDADERDEARIDRLVARGGVIGGADLGPDPELQMERVELRATVNAALAQIPDAERVVLELAYQDELTQSEIAARLGWPLGTVKTRTRRALLRMREALAAGPKPTSDGPLDEKTRTTDTHVQDDGSR